MYTPSTSPSLFVRWMRLGVVALFFWLLSLITPVLVASIPALRDYDRVVQETGIMPGALFYNDVPQSIEAQMRNRDAIRYFVHQRRNQEKEE